MQSRRRPRRLARIFATPLALAVLAIAGLVAGLAGEGVYDAAAWLLLAPMPLVLAWAWARRNRFHR